MGKKSEREDQLSAPLSPTRELAERKQTSEQKPSRPMGLLFSVKCAKPGGSFNTSEIVPRIFSTPWGPEYWGTVCILGLEARHMRPTAPHAVWPTGQQGSLDGRTQTQPGLSKLRLDTAWRSEGGWRLRRQRSRFPSAKTLPPGT